MTEPAQEITPDQFRDAIGRVPSAVAIVTTNGDDGPVALLVTTFSPASVEPPLVMVCIPRSAPGFGTFQSSVAFGVSILAESQAQVAARLMGGANAELAGPGWSAGLATGAPLLDGARVQLECALYDRHAAGDHIVLVGEVLAATSAGDDPALVRENRHFGGSA